MDWSGVNYLWIIVISCLDSHSDGTHSLQRIHWWSSDLMLNFSKFCSNEETISSISLQISANFHFWVNYTKAGINYCHYLTTQPCVKSKSHAHTKGRATHFQSQKSSWVTGNAAVLHALVEQDPADESISIFGGLPCDRVLSGQNHNKHHSRTHRKLPVLVRGRLRWISSDLSHKLCCDCRCFMGASHTSGTNQIMFPRGLRD